MIGFQICYEGQVPKQGINWCREHTDGFRLILLLWRLCIYIRRRPTIIMKGRNWQPPRWIFDLDWRPRG